MFFVDVPKKAKGPDEVAMADVDDSVFSSDESDSEDSESEDEGDLTEEQKAAKMAAAAEGRPEYKRLFVERSIGNHEVTYSSLLKDLEANHSRKMLYNDEIGPPFIKFRNQFPAGRALMNKFWSHEPHEVR